MRNTKTITAGVLGLLCGLALGYVLGLLAGRIDKEDRTNKEKQPGKIAVFEKDKPGTTGELGKEQPGVKAAVSKADKANTVYSGTVTDVAGNAIEGAKLHILGHYGIKTVSDLQGEYEISWDASEVPESRDIYIISRHEEKNLAAATEVRSETQTQNITLLPAITATGRITDRNGEAIENGTVYFGFTTAKGYVSSFANHKLFAADKGGVYKIPFIPANHLYRVGLHGEGYGSKQNISVHTDDAVDGILDLGSTALSKADQLVSGVVVRTDGKPVSKIQVFRKGAGQPVGCEETDAEGRFSLEVCEGEVILDAVISREDGVLLAGRVRVESGTDNIRIVLEPHEERR